MTDVVCMFKLLNRKTRVSFCGRASGIKRRKASLYESLRHVCHPLWISGQILAAKGSDQALGKTCMCRSWSRRRRSEKGGGCGSGVGQESEGGQVEQM